MCLVSLYGLDIQNGLKYWKGVGSQVISCDILCQPHCCSSSVTVACVSAEFIFL